MAVLLHACCADCTLKMVESLIREHQIIDQDITVYYYNPNIHPRQEFLARKDAVKQVLEGRDITIRVGDWSAKAFFAPFAKLVKSDSFDIWSAKQRCPHCWQVRLKATFEFAKLNGFDLVSSTLFSSKYQDLDVLEKIVSSLSNQYGIGYVIPEVIACDMSTRGFYKQNFCGCVYSLKKRMDEKYLG